MPLNLLKIFFYTAYKPWEKRLEALENVMHMEKIMNTESEHWRKNNDKIPMWFYQMIASMGLSVCLGFFLILAGSI